MTKYETGMVLSYMMIKMMKFPILPCAEKPES